MARIAFFTERLPPDLDPVSVFSFELMKSLADQQHELLISSTYRYGDDLPPSHPRIEFVRPFKTWNWLEVPRMIPLLLQFRPEILHLIQPRGEALRGFTNAMTAIPSLATVLGAGRVRLPIVSSFYDVRAKDLKYHRPLLAASHAVTVPNEPQRALVEGFLGSLKHAPPVFVLPVPSARTPISGAQADTAEASMEASLSSSLASRGSGDPLTEVLSRLFVYVPGDISDHEQVDSLFTEVIATLEAATDVHIVLAAAGPGADALSPGAHATPHCGRCRSPRALHRSARSRNRTNVLRKSARCVHRFPPRRVPASGPPASPSA